VIIILESFGREHIDYYNNNGRSLTPFLDSLFSLSYTFEAWANGKRSIESMPAIVAAIPTLMPVDYPTSPYVTNRINGLGTILGAKGYHTSFFHGGNNGTMSFDAFANTSGFVHYYGRNEYNNDADFDGKWGIYDEPFLQYVADEMNNFPQPFLSGVFTLSSHHPYSVPEQYANSFPHANSRLEESISYTDLALSRFFNKISIMPWYRNTIFVITADHTSESNEDPLYRTLAGNYAIPLAFYTPGSTLRGEAPFTAQQSDVMPSVLAMLGYDKPFVAFGENLFDSTATHFAINYNNNIYQLIKNDYILHFNGEQSLALYYLPEDQFMEINLLRKEDSVRIAHENFTKAIIQQYNHRLIHNQLIISE
jgi:phosphoglycerol transferase MdoB-like AlkP superfamily enzyme